MSEFFDIYGKRLLIATELHFKYAITSVAIAFVIAVLLGILLSRIPRFATVILPIISVLQTIPAIVFLGILFLYMGIRPRTAITALTIYAIFPILKNTYIGLIEIPAENKEAAKGCGMTALQSLVKVEIPLVLPAIISGLRMSTVYTVSWTVTASLIGLGGLGDFIYAGVSSLDSKLILAGVIPSALMAITLSRLIDLLRILLIPKPLRRDIK